MISKINSPAFKGYLVVYANKSESNNPSTTKEACIDTDNIETIGENREDGYTYIYTENDSLEYYIPKKIAKAHEIFSAYSAACLKNDIFVHVGRKNI